MEQQGVTVQTRQHVVNVLAIILSLKESLQDAPCCYCKLHTKAIYNFQRKVQFLGSSICTLRVDKSVCYHQEYSHVYERRSVGLLRN
jgi:hypothetical protein